MSMVFKTMFALGFVALVAAGQSQAVPVAHGLGVPVSGFGVPVAALGVPVAALGAQAVGCCFCG